MEVTGACFCGAIKYRADIDEARIGICHCRDCQIFSGSAFRLACAADPGAFEIVEGSPRHFDKRADSGGTRRMVFCGDCGTHLCSRPVGTEGYVSVRIATSSAFDQLAPVTEIFCDSRVGWLPSLEGARQFPRMPTPAVKAGDEPV